MKCVSVLNRKPTHKYRKICCKEESVLFQLFCELPCLNICPLKCETIEFIGVICLCKHIKFIYQKYVLFLRIVVFPQVTIVKKLFIRVTTYLLMKVGVSFCYRALRKYSRRGKVAAQEMKFSIKDFYRKFDEKCTVSCGFGHT